jgi:hypothetical protein
MLIDFSLISPGVASKSQVDALNAVHAGLTARLVEQIVIPEGRSTFRGSNYIRIFLQAHLRRILQLVEGAFTLFFEGRGVVALMCARGIYEGTATVLDFERELVLLIETGSLEEIFSFPRTKLTPPS